MNILFLTLSRIETFDERGIYIDLLNHFMSKGHCVYVASPVERREGLDTELIECKQGKILRIKTGNVKKVNLIEKGISTVLLSKQFEIAVKKYFKNVHFDLILYSTPPITLQKVIQKLKNRSGAKTYLLLKDIFPQNAVDLGMFNKSSLIYKYFRNMEKKLYAVSDYIGCMSKANVEYLLMHNPEIPREKVDVCPNSVLINEGELDTPDRTILCEKYSIPQDKKIFMYGGNLGKPQGIDFIIKCLDSVSSYKDAYFVIVGSGTEFSKLEKYVEREETTNVTLIKQLPKNEYDMLLSVADVGLIFLDKRFTIPNFPSRLLAYMQMEKPVLAVTDNNTDVGQVILEAEMGDWCFAGDEQLFVKKIMEFCETKNLGLMGENAKKYLREHYSVGHSYDVILKQLKEVK